MNLERRTSSVKKLQVNLSLLVFVLMTMASCAQTRKTQIYAGGSPFSNGFARVVKAVKETGSVHYKSFYIDTSGQKVFDKIVKQQFGDKDEFFGGPTDSLINKKPTTHVRVQKGTHYGMLSPFGNWILKPVYDTIITGVGPWVLVKNDKMSLYSRKGLMLPFKFEEVRILGNHFFKVEKDDLWGVYSNKKKEIVVPAKHQKIKTCGGCSNLLVKKKGKWGVVNLKNEIKVPFKYKAELGAPRKGKGVFELRKCILDTQDNKLIDLANVNPNEVGISATMPVDTMSEKKGLVIVKKGENYGLLNAETNQVLPFKFSYISFQFYNFPYVAIYRDNKKGIADTSGHIILPPVYHYIDRGYVSEDRNLFIASKHYQSELFNGKGKKVLQGPFQNITVNETHDSHDTISVQFLKTEKHNKYGIYNPKTEVLIKPKYDYISNSKFEVDLPYRVKVELKGKESFIDVRTGKLILPFLFNSVTHSSNRYLPDNLMIVGSNDKYGVYNTKTNKLLVPLKYSSIFANPHFFYIGKNDKEGLMNYKGKVLLPPVYFQIHSLNDSLLVLTKKDGDNYSYFYYNRISRQKHDLPYELKRTILPTEIVVKDGSHFKLYNPFAEKFIQGEYAKDGFPDSLDVVTSNRIAVYKNGKSGLINDQGNYIVPLQYKRIAHFNSGLALFQTKPGKEGQLLYGYMDSTGKVVIPVKYTFDAKRGKYDYKYKKFVVLLKPGKTAGHYLMGLATNKRKVVIPPIYDNIIPQYKGQDFIVKKEGEFGLVDGAGKPILPVKFENILLKDRPYLASKVKKKKLLFNDAHFDFPILAKKGKTWQYFDSQGNLLPVKVKKLTKFIKEIR